MNQALMSADKVTLAQQYKNVRQQSLALIEPLSNEDCQLQSMELCSPVKWHIAHVTWFFETCILKKFASDYQVYNPQYNYLFNSYYNAIGAQYPRAQRGLISRPNLDDVLNYRVHVDNAMQALLAQSELSDSLLIELTALVELGINHEQQHQELILMDIKHAFSKNPSYPAYLEASETVAHSTDLNWIRLNEGLVTVGHKSDNKHFSYDNEGPAHQVYLHECEIASRLVNNGEYLEFMQSGAYQSPLLWLSEGWNYIQTNQIKAPEYWLKKDDQWFEFGLHGLKPLNLNQPVCHISYFEAAAFATWAGKRLPTEFEWEAFAQTQRSFSNNLNLQQLTPVMSNDLNLNQLWQWCASSYSPYPKFKAFAGDAAEYNGKFMCNQQVLRGAACITPSGHSRVSYRNFFATDHRWQFSGIRLAQDVQ